MGDQWIELRPAFGREDAGHCCVRTGVPAEAIDGLGRKGDEAAPAQHVGSLRNVLTLDHGGRL